MLDGLLHALCRTISMNPLEGSRFILWLLSSDVWLPLHCRHSMVYYLFLKRRDVLEKLYWAPVICTVSLIREVTRIPEVLAVTIFSHVAMKPNTTNGTNYSLNVSCWLGHESFNAFQIYIAEEWLIILSSIRLKIEVLHPFRCKTVNCNYHQFPQ